MKLSVNVELPTGTVKLDGETVPCGELATPESGVVPGLESVTVTVYLQPPCTCPTGVTGGTSVAR